MSQSHTSIYSITPHDIPSNHAYIRHEEDAALCFTMEATFSVISQFRAKLQHTTLIIQIIGCTLTQQ